VSNLAQADTPEYRPVDLARSDFDGTLNVALAAPNPGHLGGATFGGGEEAGFHVIKDMSAKAGADGNAVDLDREAVKISTNQIRYDMVSQLASSELQTLEWAANDGKNG
jgi:flagellar basal-body rod protein FlgB